jgi:hypothetical protein
MTLTSRQSHLLKIVQTFLQFQTDVKMYHWQTFSYSRHKSSDKLFQNLTDLIDEFVETYMGQLNTHVRVSQSCPPIKLRNISDDQAKIIVKKFRLFLSRLEKQIPNLTTDLLNLRDELLGLTDRTLFLFTLK